MQFLLPPPWSNILVTRLLQGRVKWMYSSSSNFCRPTKSSHYIYCSGSVQKVWCDMVLRVRLSLNIELEFSFFNICWLVSHPRKVSVSPQRMLLLPHTIDEYGVVFVDGWGNTKVYLLCLNFCVVHLVICCHFMRFADMSHYSAVSPRVRRAL